MSLSEIMIHLDNEDIDKLDLIKTQGFVEKLENNESIDVSFKLVFLRKLGMHDKMERHRLRMSIPLSDFQATQSFLRLETMYDNLKLISK